MRMRSGLAIVSAVLTLGGASAVAYAQGQQHPMVDAAAAKLVQKYQSTSCEQLAAERQRPKGADKEAQKEKIGDMLRQNAQVRHEFVSKVAAPIADKMIMCGFIP